MEEILRKEPFNVKDEREGLLFARYVIEGDDII